MAATSITQQLIGDKPTTPSSGNFDISEHHSSPVIVETLQGGRITHTFTVDGLVDDTWTHPGVDQGPFNAHAWYGSAYNPNDGTQTEPAFCIERKFEHLVESSSEGGRRTKVTLTYQKMPCPNKYFEERVSGLRSMRTWYARSTPWWNDSSKMADYNGITGISILKPTIVMRRRYPLVNNVGYASIKGIEEERGHLNSAEFAGYLGNVWLFQELRFRQLWGDLSADTGVCEMVLTFIGDPERKHKYWRASRDHGTWKQDRPNVQAPPFTAQDDLDYEAGHEIQEQYPVAATAFDSLIPAPLTNLCIAPT